LVISFTLSLSKKFSQTLDDFNNIVKLAFNYLKQISCTGSLFSIGFIHKHKIKGDFK